MYAMLEACHRQVTAELRAIAGRPDSPTQRLEQLISAQIRLSTSEMPGAIRLFLRPVDWPANLASAVSRWREEHDGIFRAIIDEGVARGDFALPQRSVNRLCMQGALAFLPAWHCTGTAPESPDAADSTVVETLMRMFLA